MVINITAVKYDVKRFHQGQEKLVRGRANMVFLVLKSIVWALIKGKEAEGFVTILKDKKMSFGEID